MIEKVIYTPEAEQDVVEAYSWYEARELGWVRISCAAWRRACSPCNGIPSSTRLPWTSSAAPLSDGSHSRFSMRRRAIPSPSILFFIAHRTRRNGARESAVPGEAVPNAY